MLLPNHQTTTTILRLAHAFPIKSSKASNHHHQTADTPAIEAFTVCDPQQQKVNSYHPLTREARIESLLAGILSDLPHNQFLKNMGVRPLPEELTCATHTTVNSLGIPGIAMAEYPTTEKCFCPTSPGGSKASNVVVNKEGCSHYRTIRKTIMLKANRWSETDTTDTGTDSIYQRIYIPNLTELKRRMNRVMRKLDKRYGRKYRGMNEGENGQSLHHPHSALVVKMQSNEDLMYLHIYPVGICTVAEVIEKVSKLQSAPHLSSREKVKLVRLIGLLYRVIPCAINTVQHMHSRSIIHGDIKAENIAFESSGNIFFIDYGSSFRRYGGRLKAKHQRGFFTAGSAAPEVRRGGVCSPSGDIYSLGVLISKIRACCAARSLESVENILPGNVIDGKEVENDNSALSRLHDELSIESCVPEKLLNHVLPFIANGDETLADFKRIGETLKKVTPWIQSMIAQDSRLRPTAKDVAPSFLPISPRVNIQSREESQLTPEYTIGPCKNCVGLPFSNEEIDEGMRRNDEYLRKASGSETSPQRKWACRLIKRRHRLVVVGYRVGEEATLFKPVLGKRKYLADFNRHSKKLPHISVHMKDGRIHLSHHDLGWRIMLLRELGLVTKAYCVEEDITGQNELAEDAVSNSCDRAGI